VLRPRASPVDFRPRSKRTQIFSIRFLQSELRRGQLDGVDRTADELGERDPRAQPRSAGRRLVQLGESRTAELSGAVAPNRVPRSRTQRNSVASGYEGVDSLVQANAPSRKRIHNLEGGFFFPS